MLQPLNPLAQAATKLGRTGPSALDVGYKRLGMEQAADMASAKLASARDKVDAQKQATAQKMNAPLLKATVMQFHQDLWNKDVNDYYDWWANAQAAYSRGEGPDPVASGEAGRRINGLLQKAANSKTLEDNWKAQHEAVAKAKMEQSGAFPENADELIDQEFAKPEYYGSGQVPSYIQGMWDLEGRVKSRVSQLKMSKSGWAGPAADGGAASRHTEAYDQAEVRREAESLATEEGAAKEVQMRYERMDDKTKAEVESLIKQYGMSFTGGMLYYFMKPKTSAVQETSTYTQRGGAQIGSERVDYAMNWLAQVFDGLESGEFATSGGNRKGIVFGKKFEASGDTDVFNDYAIDEKSVTIGEGSDKKTIESRDVITNTNYDRKTGMYTISWRNDATGDEGKRRVTKEQMDSKIVPALVGLNQERILEGMGSYGTTLEKTNTGRVKGSQGERMRNSQQGGAMNPPSNTAGEAD